MQIWIRGYTTGLGEILADQSSIDIRCFFIHTKYPTPTGDWHEPIEAGVDMIYPAEKRPLWYQRLIPITKLTVSNKLGKGRSASLTLDSLSNRELFDYQDNEGLSWYREPFREWEIKITDRNTPNQEVVFRGFPVMGTVTTEDDMAKPGEQDGNWEYIIRLEGPEHFLQSDTGVHYPRTIKAYSYNTILSQLLSELNSDNIPLSHAQYSYDENTPEHQLEPFIDLGNTDIAPELPVSVDSTTWDILKKISDELSKYSLNSDGAAAHLQPGNTYAPYVSNELKIDFIRSNFRDGQEPDEWFGGTEDTFTGGTQSTRVLGETPNYVKIGQEFTAQNEFTGVYITADNTTIPNDGLITFSLKYSHGGIVIETETLWVSKAESSYSFKFPTKSAGVYYLEIESTLADNNISFKTRVNSTYTDGKLWLLDGTWTEPTNEDLEMKLLSPPYIKLSPTITKQHVAVQTGAVVKGLCETCPDARYTEARSLFSDTYDGELTISGTRVIGQKIVFDLPITPLNTIEVPVRNTSATRALAKLTVYNDTTKTIIHSQTLIPVPPLSADWTSAYIPPGTYADYSTTYYWELTAISGAFTVQYKNGLYPGPPTKPETVTSYDNGAIVTDKYYATYFVRGKNCVGFARYPEPLFRDYIHPTEYEKPVPEQYGLRGEREIQVDFNSDWVSVKGMYLTRCRNLAKEYVSKHNYPSYSAEFIITGGYAPDLVGKYVLLYNHYEGQDQPFLVTEQTHEFKRGWNSLITSFTAVRSGNKP